SSPPATPHTLPPYPPTPTTTIYPPPLHDTLPISASRCPPLDIMWGTGREAQERQQTNCGLVPCRNGGLLEKTCRLLTNRRSGTRSEEHTSELQSRGQLVCRLLLAKKKTRTW